MKWFKTWDRPEYKEWAVNIEGGYLLVIIRREDKRYLAVKAALIMRDKGLPDFKVLEEQYFYTKKDALSKIQQWKK